LWGLLWYKTENCCPFKAAVETGFLALLKERWNAKENVGKNSRPGDSAIAISFVWD
jgi:hypothetical protein